MEDWEKEAMATRIIDHALGVAIAIAILCVILRYAATCEGGRHYDAWSAVCDNMRRQCAKEK